jgi:hypothetical protein
MPRALKESGISAQQAIHNAKPAINAKEPAGTAESNRQPTYPGTAKNIQIGLNRLRTTLNMRTGSGRVTAPQCGF